MMLDEKETFYELLEIPPDASPQEIRSAYLHAKSAYRKDSVALYTLISEDETEGFLRKIEEAYQILSHPDKRREYDRSHGLLSMDEPILISPSRSVRTQMSQKIVSIDRVPPMEATSLDSDLLVPPSTDFSTEQKSFGSSVTPETNFLQPEPQIQSSAVQKPGDVKIDSNLAQEIAQEAEWKGTFLRKVREARNVSLEELSDYTKISRTYISAIEDENYPKLPAPVYLRGFVTQIAKFLKLPHEKVAAAYMARFNLARSGKN